jgi:hypothetical protein
MRSSSQTDEEALLRSWVMVDFISAFRRLAVSIASERQMELLYTILDIIPPEKLRKCMALAEAIVSINKNSFTPFSLDLALQMHHVYGSKIASLLGGADLT